MKFNSFIDNNSLSLPDKILLSLYIVKYATVEQLNNLNKNGNITVTRNALSRMVNANSSSSSRSDTLSTVSCSRANETLKAYRLTQKGMSIAHNLYIRLNPPIDDDVIIMPDLGNYTKSKSAMDHFVASNDLFFSYCLRGDLDSFEWSGEHYDESEEVAVRADALFGSNSDRYLLEQDFSSLRKSRLKDKFIKSAKSFEYLGNPHFIFAIEQPFRVEKVTLGILYKEDVRLRRLESMKELTETLLYLYNNYSLNEVTPNSILEVQREIKSKKVSGVKSNSLSAYMYSKLSMAETMCERILNEEAMYSFAEDHTKEDLKEMLESEFVPSIKMRKKEIKDEMLRPVYQNRIKLVRGLIKNDSDLSVLYDKAFQSGRDFLIESNDKLVEFFKLNDWRLEVDYHSIANQADSAKGELIQNNGSIHEGTLLLSRSSFRFYEDSKFPLLVDDLSYNIGAQRRFEIMYDQGVFNRAFVHPPVIVYRHLSIDFLKDFVSQYELANKRGNARIYFFVGKDEMKLIGLDEIEIF